MKTQLELNEKFKQLKENFNVLRENHEVIVYENSSNEIFVYCKYSGHEIRISSVRVNGLVITSQKEEFVPTATNSSSAIKQVRTSKKST